MGIHCRDLDPGRRLRSKCQQPDEVRKVIEGGDKPQLHTRFWKSQVARASGLKGRSSGRPQRSSGVTALHNGGKEA